MTDWKTYRIVSRNIDSSYIRFGLDDYVRYNNGSEKRIDCVNCSPFSEWREGDEIKIDNDATSGRFSKQNIKYDDMLYRWRSWQQDSSPQTQSYYLQQKVSGLEAEKSNLQSQLQTQNDRFQQTISHLQAQLQVAELGWKKSKSDLDVVESILTDLRGENKQLDLKTLNAYKDAPSRLEQILKENEELRTKLGIGEVEKNDLQFSIKRKGADIVAKDAEINELKRNREDLQREINRLDEELRELRKNADQNKYKIKRLERDKNNLENDLKEVDEVLKVAEKERQDLEEQVSQLQQKAGAGDSKLLTESEKEEVKSFLNNYIKMMKMRIKDCEEIMAYEKFEQEEKHLYQEERQGYEAKIEQIQPFISKIDNWGIKK